MPSPSPPFPTPISQLTSPSMHANISTDTNDTTHSNISHLSRTQTQTQSDSSSLIDLDSTTNRNLVLAFSMCMLGAGFMLGVKRGTQKPPPSTLKSSFHSQTLASTSKQTTSTPILLNTPTHLRGNLMREHTRAMKISAQAKEINDYKSAASALGIATVLSVGMFSTIVIVTCKGLGVDNAKDFRVAMQNILRPSQPNPSPRTNLSSQPNHSEETE